MSMQRNVVPLPLIFAAVAGTTVGQLPAAHAGGFHISIIGVRRTGMLTNMAAPDDVSALFHNPAGLADQPGTRIQISNAVTFLNTQFRLKALDPERFPEINPNCDPSIQSCPWPVDEQGYYREEIEPERYTGVIPYLGASQDLGFVSPSLKDVVVSAALYAPGAYGAFLPEDAPTAYYVVSGHFVVVAATAGLGWRINDKIAVGANGSFTHMRLGFAQNFSLIDLMTPDGESPDLTTGIAQATLGDLRLNFAGRDNGAGWGLGTLITPFSDLSIGLSYAGWTRPTFEGPVTVRSLGSKVTGSHAIDADHLRPVVLGFGFKLPTELRVQMPIPPAFQGGLVYRLSSRIEIGLDYRLWLYSRFKRQKITPIYNPEEPGDERISEEDLSHDKHYSNSWDVSAGVLVRPLAEHPDVELMAGVMYDESPVPDETFSLDNPSLNQLMFAAGVRATLADHWRLGFSYMLTNYLRRTVSTSKTSPPTNAQVSARGHLPTLEVEYIF